MEITVNDQHDDPIKLTSQFAYGVYGLGLHDFVEKIIHEIQEEISDKE